MSDLHSPDNVIEWLRIGLLVFMLLTFGAAHASSEEVVVIWAGVIVVYFLLRVEVSGPSGYVRQKG